MDWDFVKSIKRELRFFNEYATSQSRRFSHNLNENESGIHKGFFLTQKPRSDWWSLCGIGDSVDCDELGGYIVFI
jgi:hypothetical protein